MAETRRKLAAILAADAVGFSRMMGADEERTLATLKACREVIDILIEEYDGTIFGTAGDSVVAEFASPVDAVRCAVDIQRALGGRNAQPDGERMTFRIGINLGDVIIEGDNLFGDGVNIAARLETIAEPGGVCISEAVYRHIKNKLTLDYGELGEQALKNIAEPVPAYRIELDSTAARDAMTDLADGEPAAPHGPRAQPAIAVLPFDNMSGDAEQDYFADGLTEDLITTLSHCRSFPVISRNSSFAYKGASPDVRQVARELGCRYVLEGSVRRAGDRVRITGQLIDAATGTHLWADKFDGRLEDVFDLQDEITANVVGALEPTMRKAEIERARRKPAEHMGAYDLYLQALPYIYAIRPDDNLQALGLLERAIELDGNYAPALAHAGWCLVQRATRAWPAYGDDDVGQAVSWARRALAAGSDDAKAVALGGFVLVMLRQDYVAGLDALHRSVEMNPGSGFVTAMAGSGLVFGDVIETGLQLMERAMALCPKDPSFFSFLTVAASGRLFTGNPEMAIELANRSVALNPGWDSTYWVLITAYTQLGRTEEAAAAARKLLVVYPEASAARYERVLPIRNPESLAMVIRSLRDAGIPD